MRKTSIKQVCTEREGKEGKKAGKIQEQLNHGCQENIRKFKGLDCFIHV